MMTLTISMFYFFIFRNNCVIYYLLLSFYSQKLAFSDDELPGDRDHRKEHILKKEAERMEAAATMQQSQDIRNNSGNNNANVPPARGWGPARPASGNSQPATPQTARGGGQGMRAIEDEDLWNQRRRQHSEEVAIAVERAKIRKEEEEKRFMELKQVRLYIYFLIFNKSYLFVPLYSLIEMQIPIVLYNECA